MTRQSNALLFRMNSGIPGDVTRRQFTVVEPVQLNPGSAPFSAYGLPGKFVSGKFVPIQSGDTAAVVAGFLARPYPIQTANADGSGIGNQVFGDQVRRGFIAVACNAGTPATEGAVYMRVANAGSGTPIGGIEAASVSTQTATATGGNTGNGTCSVPTISGPTVLAGNWEVLFTAATKFNLIDPNGTLYQGGTTGVAYTAGGLSFTITAGGTAFAAGDSFTIANVYSTVLLPNAQFKSAADASGNVEVQYNI